MTKQTTITLIDKAWAKHDPLMVEVMRRYFADGGFYLASTKLKRLLGLAEASVLEYLLNERKILGSSDSNRERGHLYFCTVQQMKDDLGLCQRTQHDLLKRLQKLGLLELLKLTRSRKRYIRLLLEKLLALENPPAVAPKITPKPTKPKLATDTVGVENEPIRSEEDYDAWVAGGMNG